MKNKKLINRVYQLYYVEKLTMKVIAERLGYSERHIRRVVKELKASGKVENKTVWHSELSNEEN